jgi:hypothetical protein
MVVVGEVVIKIVSLCVLTRMWNVFGGAFVGYQTRVNYWTKCEMAMWFPYHALYDSKSK